jgi:hypothetical protein
VRGTHCGVVSEQLAYEVSETLHSFTRTNFDNGIQLLINEHILLKDMIEN